MVRNPHRKIWFTSASRQITVTNINLKEFRVRWNASVTKPPQVLAVVSSCAVDEGTILTKSSEDGIATASFIGAAMWNARSAKRGPKNSGANKTATEWALLMQL